MTGCIHRLLNFSLRKYEENVVPLVEHNKLTKYIISLSYQLLLVNKELSLCIATKSNYRFMQTKNPEKVIWSLLRL